MLTLNHTDKGDVKRKKMQVLTFNTARGKGCFKVLSGPLLM